MALKRTLLAAAMATGLLGLTATAQAGIAYSYSHVKIVDLHGFFVDSVLDAGVAANDISTQLVGPNTFSSSTEADLNGATAGSGVVTGPNVDPAASCIGSACPAENFFDQVVDGPVGQANSASDGLPIFLPDPTDGSFARSDTNMQDTGLGPAAGNGVSLEVVAEAQAIGINGETTASANTSNTTLEWRFQFVVPNDFSNDTAAILFEYEALIEQLQILDVGAPGESGFVQYGSSFDIAIQTASPTNDPFFSSETVFDWSADGNVNSQDSSGTNGGFTEVLDAADLSNGDNNSVGGGDSNLGGGSFQVWSGEVLATGVTYDLVFQLSASATANHTAVPEPAALGLLSLGLFAVGGIARRRRLS
jgi:hypothetical protein